MHKSLGDEMYRFILKMYRKFKVYPAQRPTKSGYIRTGTLKRSWFPHVERRPGLIVGKVASSPEIFARAYHWRRSPATGKRLGPYRGGKSYAPYVMGKAQSKEMKGRGWKQVGKLLKKEWPGQVRRFREIINRSR